MKAVESCISSWSSKKGKPAKELSHWKDVFKQVKEKIAELKLTYIFQSTNSSVQDPYVKKVLQDLHNNFVVTPIDKANCNVVIICKQLYAIL